MRRDIMVGKKLGVLGILDAHDNLDIARFARIGRTGRAFEMFADRFLRWKKVAPLEQTGSDIRRRTNRMARSRPDKQLVKAARARIVVMAGSKLVKHRVRDPTTEPFNWSVCR